MYREVELFHIFNYSSNVKIYPTLKDLSPSSRHLYNHLLLRKSLSLEILTSLGASSEFVLVLVGRGNNHNSSQCEEELSTSCPVEFDLWICRSFGQVFGKTKLESQGKTRQQPQLLSMRSGYCNNLPCGVCHVNMSWSSIRICLWRFFCWKNERTKLCQTCIIQQTWLLRKQIALLIYWLIINWMSLKNSPVY